MALGKHEAALASARVAAATAPGDADAQGLAATLLVRFGRPDLALPFSEALVRLRPIDARALAMHAGLLASLGRFDEGVAIARRALEIEPGNLAAITNLAGALADGGRPFEALARAEEGLVLAPEDPVLLNTRAQALHALGRADEAYAVVERLVALAPDHAGARAAAATLLNYLPGRTLAEARRAHEALGRLVAITPLPPRPPLPPIRDRLRVGLVSADLRTHSVAYFIEPILEHLDRSRFEVFVYSTNPRADATTARLKGYPSAWRDLTPADARTHAGRIAADRLHVLIELAGLTRGQSLPVLAWRPAPIQGTYLGYPNTTGCAFVDVRFVDSTTDPPGTDDSCVERLVRVDPCFVCYRPPDALPGIEARAPGRPITFGCFGTVQKYNAALLALWWRVLAGAPGSRLVLKSQGIEEAGARGDVLGRLARAGIDPARVEILPPAGSMEAHLSMYGRMDVALDTFPYHGTTTTCEALAMGVPTVTLEGGTHAARVGCSLLRAAGLSEWIARDAEEYAAIAARLATDPGTTRGIDLRERVRGSVLCDGRGFADRFGAALERVVAGARA